MIRNKVHTYVPKLIKIEQMDIYCKNKTLQFLLLHSGWYKIPRSATNVLDQRAAVRGKTYTE